MARVGLDLDGVLYDFTSNFRDALVKLRKWPEAECPPSTRWSFYEDWGLSTVGFRSVCNEAADAGILFRHGLYAPGTHRIIEAIQAAGHTVHIVTDRSFGTHPGASQISTVRWLQSANITYDSLTFVADKTIVGLDYMLDDKPENVVALREAGCEAYLFDQPWNQDLLLPRVDSLDAYLEKVTAKSE